MTLPDHIARPARVEDCKWIYGFVCELEQCDFDYPVFKELFIRNISDINNVYLVAEKEGAVSGYVSCHGQYLLHHGGLVFEIQELYVKEEFRNKGLGQFLIQKLESALSQFDYRSLEVTANKKREKTHDFYVKMGFELTHFKFTKAKE